MNRKWVLIGIAVAVLTFAGQVALSLWILRALTQEVCR